MNEERELRFRKTINELTKSGKGAIILLDGKAESLKSDMLDKLIDKIEPSRYKLCKFNGDEDFTMKQFWENCSRVNKLVIWDGSYKQQWKYLDKDELKDAMFFEQQMSRYNSKVFAYKFKNNDSTKIEIKSEKNQTVIYGKNKDEVFDLLIDDIINSFNQYIKTPIDTPTVPEHLTSASYSLKNVDNKYVYNEDSWKELQEIYQKKIRDMHEKLIDKGKSMLVVLQGIDGAGKSSTIRRLISKMCPHWYSVYGFGVPTERDLEHHWMWRFWTKFPKPGEIVIFDRSYYERLLAERMGKLNNNGWIYGVEEIKELERELEAHDILVVKFWMNISYETQGERFEERKTNPLKSWKISKSDLKTREKFPELVACAEEMIAAFNSDPKAIPFNVIDSTNKREARVEVLSIIVNKLKKFLKGKKNKTKV